MAKFPKGVTFTEKLKPGYDRVLTPDAVGFIARLRLGRFPGSGARKLPSSTNNLLGWVLPPLVICAVEAHPLSPFFVHRPLSLALVLA